MIVNLRLIQASLLAMCVSLPWATSEDIDPTPPPSGVLNDVMLSPPLTELGVMCKDTTSLSIPTTGSPKIVTGTHTKLYPVADCSYFMSEPIPATIYQIEGTGVTLDVSLFWSPFGDSSQIAVFEGCPRDNGKGNGNGFNDNMDMGGEDEMYSNCVDGQYYQGARWQAKAGQVYTIVVYSFVSMSSSDFILRLETVEENPICGNDGTLPMIDLGKLNVTSSSVQTLGGPEESVLVTRLPQCDYQTQSSSVLYRITVSQPDVVVSVLVEGGDNYVTVYQGNCESGYSCVASTIGGNNYSPAYDQSYIDETGNEQLVLETVEIALPSDQVDVSQEGSTIFRYNYNMHSFFNEKAGTTYLVSVNSCCGTDVSDFRLTVNTTSYGKVCEDAVTVDLSLGEFAAAVDLSNGNLYKDLNSCYTEIYYDSTSPEESSSSTYTSITGPITGPTAIYKITGDGKTYVAYIAPSNPNAYNVQIRMALLTSNSCDQTPQCIQGDNYNSFMSIETTAGETYYLALYTENSESSGSFDLQISAVSNKAPCDDAIDLGTIGSTGRTVNGTTVGVGLYKTAGMCDAMNDVRRPRVFSFVAEAEGTIMATVKAPFYPHVTVVTSCDNGECLAGLTTFETDVMTPGAVWNTEPGMTYYVVVYAYDVLVTGDFELTLETLNTTQICENEDVVDMGTLTEEGTTFDGTKTPAALFAIPESCQQVNMYYSALTRGVLYRLVGDGNAYMLSVNSYTFTPQFTVLKGSCDNLECIPTDPYASTLLLDTEPGVSYTILIGDCCSASGMEGTFQLHAKKIPAGRVTTNVTDTIPSFRNETIKVTGSTVDGLLYPNLPMCYSSINAPAAVYKLETVMGAYSAKVTGFGLDVQLSVYKVNDSENGMECHGIHNYQSVSWEVGEEQSSLYLVVHGCCDASAVGEFVLRLSHSTVSGDDLCNDDVIDLGTVVEDGLMYIGNWEGWSSLPLLDNTTDDTSSSSLIGCVYEGHYAHSSGPTKIFTVTGNGKLLTATTFLSQSTLHHGIDMSLTVVQQFCGSVECVEGAYSESLSSGSLTWSSVVGETYDIVVSTCCSSSSSNEDEFVLMVYEQGTKTYGYEYPPVW